MNPVYEILIAHGEDSIDEWSQQLPVRPVAGDILTFHRNGQSVEARVDEVEFNLDENAVYVHASCYSAWPPSSHEAMSPLAKDMLNSLNAFCDHLESGGSLDDFNPESRS